MTSSSNNTDQLRYGFSDYPDHMSILGETSNAKPFVHVAQIWDDAAFQRFLAAHDAELTERVRSETLKAAAADFARAAHAGIEPELNMLAAKLLSDRAARSAPETEQAAIRKAGTNA